MTDNPPMVASLAARFAKLAAALRPGVDTELIKGWFHLLWGLYRQPHRRYHTLHHIATLLERMDENFTKLGPHPDLEVAIWFHDAIYDLPPSAAGANEQASAQLASTFMHTIDVVKRTTLEETVVGAIAATMHDGKSIADVTAGNIGIARMMVDLDLSGFADPWEKFEDNNRLIREEYSFASDKAYRWGRLKFLSDLMSRPIFHILDRLEAPARSNIERHMADLLAGRL